MLFGQLNQDVYLNFLPLVWCVLMDCLVCHLMCLSTKTTENSISLLRLRG